jgi:hypothetical protein
VTRRGAARKGGPYCNRQDADSRTQLQTLAEPDPSAWADAFLKRCRVLAAFRYAEAERRAPYVHTLHA